VRFVGVFDDLVESDLIMLLHFPPADSNFSKQCHRDRDEGLTSWTGNGHKHNMVPEVLELLSPVRD
jgi:hypothetical protein